MVVRMNKLQRPSSIIELRLIESEVAKYRFTLEEELTRVLNRNPSISLTPSIDHIMAQLNSAKVVMNNERYHAFFSRMERLVSNADTFASFYELNTISREDLIDFISSSSIKNDQDVEDYPCVKALEYCKEVFTKELVPLFAAWVSQFIYDNYAMALKVTLEFSKFSIFKGNKRYISSLKKVIRREYFYNIKEMIEYLPKRNTVAFLERVNSNREEVKILKGVKEKKQKSAKIREQLKEGVRKLISKAIPEVPGEMEKDIDYIEELNKNTSPQFLAERFLSLTDDEVEALNHLSKTHFQHLLASVLKHFFTEILSSLDWVYNISDFENQYKLSMKWWYFDILSEAGKNKDEHFKSHMDVIKKIPKSRRYQGFTLEQHLSMNMIVIKDILSDSNDDDNNNNENINKNVNIINENKGKKNKNKKGIENDLFDDMEDDYIAAKNSLTYKLPSACLPGYYEPLDNDYNLSAITFLTAYFRDNDELKETLLEKAVKAKEVRVSLNNFTKALSAYLSSQNRRKF